MQLAQKNVTSDQLVIYEFYETLAKEVEHLEIADKAEAFYNCDELGLPVDPSKCKYIGPIGKKTIQVPHGANGENQKVLAVCSADGKALGTVNCVQWKIPPNNMAQFRISQGHLFCCKQQWVDDNKNLS